MKVITEILYFHPAHFYVIILYVFIFKNVLRDPFMFQFVILEYKQEVYV